MNCPHGHRRAAVITKKCSDHEIFITKISFMGFSAVSRNFWTTKIWSYTVVHVVVTFPILDDRRIFHVLQHLSARVQLYDTLCAHYLSAIRHLALSCGGHISRNLKCHAV